LFDERKKQWIGLNVNPDLNKGFLGKHRKLACIRTITKGKNALKLLKKYGSLTNLVVIIKVVFEIKIFRF
jgi:hypothetical protein